MSLANRWPWFADDRVRDELFRVFSPFQQGPSAPRSAGVFPSVNIYDDGNAFLVRAELPGVNKDTLEITAKGDQLTLRGDRVIATARTDASYHRRECDGGQFRRVLTLPQAVDTEKIEATFRDGVLEVVLPRVPSALPRRIAVN
jgi:HSP20 family protein